MSIDFGSIAWRGFSARNRPAELVDSQIAYPLDDIFWFHGKDEERRLNAEYIISDLRGEEGNTAFFNNPFLLTKDGTVVKAKVKEVFRLKLRRLEVRKDA